MIKPLLEYDEASDAAYIRHPTLTTPDQLRTWSWRGIRCAPDLHSLVDIEGLAPHGALARAAIGVSQQQTLVALKSLADAGVIVLGRLREALAGSDYRLGP
jgi:hypothetical protein